VLDEDIFAEDLAVNPPFRDVEWLPRRRAAPEVTRRAIAAGIPYACGTDSMHGGMAYEVRAHVEIGIPAETAILAATRNAAEACGLLERVGTLEPGKQADLIAVDGDPLADITALRRGVAVISRGRRFVPAEVYASLGVLPAR
jgi:imidazolonepropionase-like amidohydrolase